MKIVDCLEFKIILLDSPNEDTSLILNSYNESDLIYVALQGYCGEDLSSERFLVQNAKSSFHNHMMWEGLFDAEEQEQYIEKCCRRFWDTNKQMVIEDYDYQEDEPFYDYSK